MIPVVAIIHIDTRGRAISSRRSRAHEFQGPIYFLMTRDAYVRGWCELDRNTEWLTLIPHPLSPASSHRWKYGTDTESLGRYVDEEITIREGNGCEHWLKATNGTGQGAIASAKHQVLLQGNSGT
jgi:hypothetical protein